MKTFTGMKLFVVTVLALTFIVSCGENNPSAPSTGGDTRLRRRAQNEPQTTSPLLRQTPPPPATVLPGPLQKTATIALLIEAKIADTEIKNMYRVLFSRKCRNR